MYVAALLLVLTIIAMNDIAFVQLSCRRVHPSQPSFLGVSWGFYETGLLVRTTTLRNRHLFESST